MAEVMVIELRFEDYANNNHKFYRTYTWNNGGLTQWGRIGTKGQFKRVQRVQAQRKVEDKQNTGYVVTTPWTNFEVDGSVMSKVTVDDPAGFSQLDDAANRAIGSRVAPPAAKTEGEVEKDFASKLLEMAGRYRKPEPETKAPAEPDAPKADPNSIEGRLGAALAAAKKQ